MTFVRYPFSAVALDVFAMSSGSAPAQVVRDINTTIPSGSPLVVTRDDASRITAAVRLSKKSAETLAAVFIACLSIIQTAHAADLPDPALTPGVINPDVTQANIDSTVCVKGWTKTVRPPVYYTNGLKKSQITQYRYADAYARDYEEDHLIPLSVGGNPTDPRNLWPEPRKSEWNADRKDELEFAMYMGVCHREISLDEAQRAFATNWIEAYKRYGAFLQRYRYGSAD